MVLNALAGASLSSGSVLILLRCYFILKARTRFGRLGMDFIRSICSRSMCQVSANLMEFMNNLLLCYCLSCFISNIKDLLQQAIKKNRATSKQEVWTRGRQLANLLCEILQPLGIEVQTMSNFRIQRKLTQGCTIKSKIPIAPPPRIKSLQSKQSFSRSPKKIDHQSLRKLVQKIAVRRPSEQSQSEGKARLEEGIKAYKEKNVTKATDIFKELYKNGIKSAELAFYLGSCLLNTGKHQASIMYLNECISLNSLYSPNAYLYVAVNFKMLNNLKQAIRALETGLELFPNFEEAAFYKAKLFMKLGDYSQAIDAFYSCLKLNPSNELAILFLGDCFRWQGKTDKAVEQYLKIVKKGKKHTELGAQRAASIYIDRQEYQEAYEILCPLPKKVAESAQLNLLTGQAFYGLGRKQEAVIYFESCVAIAKDLKSTFRAWKYILKIAIDNCDFYEADHQINRIALFGLEEDKYKQWKFFVEGVADLIKRRNVSAAAKLQKARQMGQKKLQNPNRPIQLEAKQLLSYVYSYVGYSSYINNNIGNAIQMYDRALQYNCQNMMLLHSRLILQGIALHSSGQNQRAIGKFQEAFSHLKRAEVPFMAAITLIRQYKAHPNNKTSVFQQVQNYLVQACQVEQKTPLLLFFYSLLLLFLNKPCASVISRAIKNTEESISEYFFIYALALQSEGKLKDALEAISKAIEIDSNILEFYRERSKYYFLAEDYNLAIEDCKKAESMDPQDEEIHLLLAFYLYLVGEYRESWCYLRKVAPSVGKLKQFQLALCLRLGKYQKLGEIGVILTSLSQQVEIPSSSIEVLNQFIAERYQFSQFSVYFYHLILSVIYASKNDYTKGLVHLFGCLQEIQVLMDDKTKNQSTFQVTFEETEAMLDEIKLNITIMSLLQGNFQETERYVTAFSQETTSQELKQILAHVMTIVRDTEYDGEVQLAVQNEEPKLSDQFPNFTIPIHRAKLTTKLVVSYPVKLKFTITPEFDPAYLYNFDIQKIEFKIPPPWLKPPSKRLNFTEQICEQSLHLSDSNKSLNSQRHDSLTGHFQIVQRLKLDKSLEERLERLIHK